MLGNEFLGREIGIIQIVVGEMESSDSAEPEIPSPAVKKDRP
jgi:hypothetical protein